MNQYHCAVTRSFHEINLHMMLVQLNHTSLIIIIIIILNSSRSSGVVVVIVIRYHCKLSNLVVAVANECQKRSCPSNAGPTRLPDHGSSPQTSETSDTKGTHSHVKSDSSISMLGQHWSTYVNIAFLVSAEAMMAQAETPARNTPSTL